MCTESTSYYCSGTYQWMAPEVFSDDSYDPFQADSEYVDTAGLFLFLVWSFGVLLYELMTGEVPKRSPEEAAVGKLIRFPPAAVKQLPVLHSVAQKCLQVNPDNRPTPTNLLKIFKEKLKQLQ